mmetsp:Transcript_3330/g.8374  ORF Transcript_3330/g.8374 Transcript_3330/m.8374 type:complete len:112 (-) Transcript_3330:597-932(-)
MTIDSHHEYFEERDHGGVVNPNFQGHEEAMGTVVNGFGADHLEKHSYDFIMNPKTHTPNWFDAGAFGGAAGVTEVFHKSIPGLEALMRGDFGLLPCDNPTNRETCQSFEMD